MNTDQKIQAIQEEASEKIEALLTAQDIELKPLFDNHEGLQAAIKACPDSGQYTHKDNDIVSWARLLGLDYFVGGEDTCLLPALVRYVEGLDEGLFVDLEQSYLYYLHGPSIIINSEGDIFDEYTCIIDVTDYEVNGEVDISLRNRLIERYMEKSDHYPGVFHTDRYGNVCGVETTA